MHVAMTLKLDGMVRGFYSVAEIIGAESNAMNHAIPLVRCADVTG